MTLKEIISEIEELKNLVPEESWDEFTQQDIFVNITNLEDIGNLQFTAICGSYLPYGLEVVIEPKGEV